MKKKIGRKLALSRETLRSLGDAALGTVAGGVTNTNCNTCYISCQGYTCFTDEFDTCACPPSANC